MNFISNPRNEDFSFHFNCTYAFSYLSFYLELTWIIKKLLNFTIWNNVCGKSLQSCPTLWDIMECSLPGSSIHGDSPGKNTGVGCHALLQGIFPIQGSNLCLLCLLFWEAGSLPLAPAITEKEINQFTWERCNNVLRIEISQKINGCSKGSSFPKWLGDKKSACQCRRCGFHMWQSTPVFLLGKPMARGAWQATVHGVTESDTTEQNTPNILSLFS